MEIHIKEIRMNIWDFWAKKYNKLWVQKYSLTPTRDYLLKVIDIDRPLKILDLGCGPGELIAELLKINANLDITGLDFSKGMLNESIRKNPSAKHIQMDVSNLHNLDDKFDIIISTHSLPYWKNSRKVMKDLSTILADDGRLYIGFASGNNFTDKLALFFVKFTTGPANYPSDNGFRELLNPYFSIKDLKIIKEKKFMPRIAVYTLGRLKS